ncbi:MAG: hypothetical protein JJU29_02300 [Verrucomicrobia bacterium]|nr:hypothetical protein [Verrucomicrobiota bacterium]
MHLLPLRQCHEPEQVGGKAINLARMIQAGFPVPGGFVLTTRAYAHAIRETGGKALPEAFANQVRRAYRDMGSPTVAVRSSATAEDREDASMAGQYETILNVRDEEPLLAAILQCWSSLDSPRTRSYLARLGLRPDQVAMGVVVQEQVAAEVAGVLFTVNPRGGSGDTLGEMLVEASWGLGESVVSGEVQPDTFVLDRQNGRVLHSVIGSKATTISPVSGAEASATKAERQGIACLDSHQILALWQLGCEVQRHYGRPQDIEWAFADGKLYLLQSRAITTLEQIEAYEACLTTTREQIREGLKAGRGPWVPHNLGETLPHPTPLSWDIISRFMSGAGGFGNLYRHVGFVPSDEVTREGFLDRIAGRIHMDLSRASDMFFENFPFQYDVDLLRRNPGASQEPPTIPSGSRMDLYKVGKRLGAVSQILDKLAVDFDRTYESKLLPEFEAWVKEEKQRDLQVLTVKEWRELWAEREKRVLDEFAPQTLLPSLIVTQVLQQLRDFLEQQIWDEDPETLLRKLSGGGPPDLTLQSTQMLYEAGKDEARLKEWLTRFGHRAPSEFDLAVPRWRERPEEVRDMARRLAEGEPPMRRHQLQAESAKRCRDELAAMLSPELVEELDTRIALVHRYARFREDGKHALMLGYDLLRDLVLEVRRRLDVSDDICLLRRGELHDALLTGFAPLHLLEQRRRIREAEARFNLPAVLDAESLDALGEPPEIVGCDRLTGLAVSDGFREGPVRIVHSPEKAGELGKDYVLVCPSTDPNWTPLFVGAAGLVLECGGSLSHGAVVAREMGLPAVVIPHATRLFAEGEVIRVDGRRGAVIRGAGDEDDPGADDESAEIPRALVPPVAGPKEFKAGALRDRFLLIWVFFFAVYYALPETWVQLPVTRIIDHLLLPLVARLGAPLMVAFTAVFFGFLCMAGQRLLTDTPRLREAMKRVKGLRAYVKPLPADHPHRKEAAALSSKVTHRNLMASFVPLAVLLGPMLLVFFWFPERVEPIWRNAPAQSTVYVSATVDGEYTGTVDLEGLPENWMVAEGVTRANPPVRATLEALHRRWSRRSDFSHLSTWEEQAAAMQAREAMLADLRGFLDRGLSPMEMAWIVYPPEEVEGRFPIRLRTATGEELASAVVLGPASPPEPREILDPSRPPMQVISGKGETPLIEMRVGYARSLERGGDVFWQPVERFTFPPLLSGWLVVYILAYLPSMYISRWILRVP